MNKVECVCGTFSLLMWHLFLCNVPVQNMQVCKIQSLFLALLLNKIKKFHLFIHHPSCWPNRCIWGSLKYQSPRGTALWWEEIWSYKVKADETVVYLCTLKALSLYSQSQSCNELAMFELRHMGISTKNPKLKQQELSTAQKVVRKRYASGSMFYIYFNSMLYIHFKR